MMRFKVDIEVGAILDALGPKHGPRMVGALCRGFCRGVVAQNRILLRAAKKAGRPYPALYNSGVRYGRESMTDGVQELVDLRTVIQRGWGDCKHLCCWRIAELLESGEKCPDVPRIYWRRDASGRPRMFHAQVRRAPSREYPKGLVEDPSRMLGM